MPPDTGYEVGYKKPPRHSQFKPGQSGNPRARRKQADDFASLFTETLNETVTITENGQRRKISKGELLVKQVVDRAAKGDPKAFPSLFRLMAEIDRGRKSGGVRPVVGVTEREDGTVSVMECEHGGALSGWRSLYASLEDYQRGKPPIERWWSEPPDQS